MGTPRLKGATASALRLLSQGPLRGAIWALMAKSYGITAMSELPPEARRDFDPEERPLQGAPPRRFGTGGLPVPDGRVGTARRLGAAYAAGATDPVAVLEKIEARVAAGDFGAAHRSPFVALAWERAREAAKASRARHQGGQARGPLDGVPIPVKDEHEMVGLPTLGGTVYRRRLATGDSRCVERLEAAGALVYAKTHTTEWGMSPVGFNAVHSMPRNVYSADHAPGGSSTGAAVAVGLGLAPLAVGSDGGGSIRIPAALNGLFGIKPTFVRVPRTRDIFAGGTVSHIGPLARCTADLVELLVATGIGADPEDPYSAWAQDSLHAAADWRAALSRGVKGCRIGVDAREWRDAHPALAALGQEALKALEREGARLVDVTIPFAAHAPGAGVMVLAGETMGGLLDDQLRSGAEMGEDLQIILNLLRQSDLRLYFAARNTRAALRRFAATALAGVDLLALPTVAAPTPAWPLKDDRVTVIDEDATKALCRYAFFGNLTGLPCGTAPVGLHAGLPVGLQLVGDAWDEASVLAGLAHIERLGLSDLPAPPAFRALELP
jgi:Asp-tRNA(Asn)/Glu-tRNA(Gln) amidotransferase A subunit family amidase